MRCALIHLSPAQSEVIMDRHHSQQLETQVSSRRGEETDLEQQDQLACQGQGGLVQRPVWHLHSIW